MRTNHNEFAASLASIAKSNIEPLGLTDQKSGLPLDVNSLKADEALQSTKAEKVRQH